jgi:hypothetical protein
MAKKKRVDPIKQREKRAKIVAGIGGLLLLGVGFVEVPAVLTSLNRKPPVSPSASASAAAAGAAAGNPGGSLSLPEVAGTPAGVTSSSGLTDTDAPPAASSVGQLVSFDVFEMKNPFTPQIPSAPPAPDVKYVPAGAATPGAVVPGTGTTTTTTTTPTSTTPLTPPTGTTPTTTTPTPAAAPTVAISVNGSVSRVGTEGTFPAGGPVFRLASWQHGSAEIGIVGGSYASGGQTLTLRLNQPVTLQNTHDGKQYKLILISTP